MIVNYFYTCIFLKKCFPCRALICIMMFTACWTSYMCRLQMPILAVPMIRTNKDDKLSSQVCFQDKVSKESVKIESIWRSSDALLHEIALEEASPRLRQRSKKQTSEKRNLWDFNSNDPFEWSSFVRGQLLAAYSYGNVPGNFLGGIMAIKFGPRQTILWTSLLSAILSLISPIIANVHWCALMVSRIIIGLAGGTVFPSCHTLVAKWAPPNEKSRFVWSLLGGTFGTIFTYPMIAAIAENINWECGWYIPSTLMMIWVLFWYLLAYDSPNEHPNISEEEKNYIITAQSGTVGSQKPLLKDTPVKKIFTSVPFISLMFCHFGNIFLLFFYQNSMMIYLTKVLGYKLTKGGVLASLPWFARMSFGFFFSWSADVIRKREIMSLTALRKSATIFSHMLPGICLIVVGYLGCSFILANVFLFLALGFNGAASISNLSNNQDLSPNYAGFLYGVMNTFGTASGMIIPPMVEAIAGQHGNTIDRWQIVFWIGALVCIACMMVFIIGGSGKVQSWNQTVSKNRKTRA